MSNNETKLKGIDISEFNGFLDFEKVKKEVDFIIIRATFGRFGVDKLFKRNVENCIKYDIPFGLYYYSYALNVEQGKEEVKFFIDTIKEYKDKVIYPCFIDMEDSDSYKLNNGNPGKDILTNICLNAYEAISNEKLFPGIYASLDYFENRLDKAKLKGKTKWVAWWNEKAVDNIDKNEYSMLQYTSKGAVPGIVGKVDLNISFKDFKKAREYIENISKIQSIKLLTGLEDLTIQFMSCYKWGLSLIDKIFKRLQKDKIKRETLSTEKLKKVIKKEFELEQKTIDFLSCYIYSDFLFDKLYNSISN